MVHYSVSSQVFLTSNCSLHVKLQVKEHLGKRLCRISNAGVCEAI